MKKLIVVGLVAGLMVGALAPAQAGKKKKKPKTPPAPVAVDLKFFLTDADGCTTSENLLSLTHVPSDGCWYVDSGAPYEAIVQAGLLTPADLAVTWTATDGVPFTLDATKHVTGEITTEGGACVVSGVCAPVTLSAGNATLDVVVQGEIDGEMTDLGTFSESFQTIPGTKHTTKVDITLDAALDKKQVTNLTVATYIHGPAVLHGTVVLDDPASFVTLPALK
ncbi:MAG: hypothetical protein M3279_11120 [Actinomycetota bacterium]|nr:hypothetical protein [Actinomycetota bacterium]